MAQNKVSSRTTTRTEVNSSLIARPCVKTFAERIWDATRQQLMDESEKISKILYDEQNIDLRRETLTAISKLTGEKKTVIFYKDHLFLPVAAAKIRGDEARHLACWASIATGDKYHNINIKEDFKKQKWPIKIAGTFGKFKQTLRYAVLTPGIRCGVQDFAKNRKQLEQMIKLFNKQPGVKVQFWGIEYTILHTSSGEITFNIHANIIYTLHKSNENGFRENIKNNVCPDSYWHDRGQINPDDVDIIAKYVNKAEVKAQAKTIHEFIENSQDDTYSNPDEKYSVDGELITIGELAEINSDILGKLYRATYRAKLSGRMNEYKKFRKFLDSWGVRVEIAQHPLFGLQFQFKQISCRLTVNEKLAREEKRKNAKLAELELKKGRKAELNNTLAEIEDEKEAAVKPLKDKLTKVIGDNKRAKSIAENKIKAEAAEHGWNDDLRQKLELVRRTYNVKTNVKCLEIKESIAMSEKIYDDKAKTTKKQLQDRFKREDAEAKAKPKEAKIEEGSNIVLFEGNVFKNDEKGMWDQYIFIKNFNEEKYNTDYNQKGLIYDKADKANKEKCESLISTSYIPAIRNGWNFKEKKNIRLRELGSGQFLEALFNTYLYLRRENTPEHSRLTLNDLKFYIRRWKNHCYDPSDWEGEVMPHFSDDKIADFLEEITKEYDDTFAKAIGIQFLYCRLNILNKNLATPAVNWDSFDFSNESLKEQLWPENFLPCELECEEGYEWIDPPPNDVNLDELCYIDETKTLTISIEDELNLENEFD